MDRGTEDIDKGLVMGVADRFVCLVMDKPVSSMCLPGGS